VRALYSIILLYFIFFRRGDRGPPTPPHSTPDMVIEKPKGALTPGQAARREERSEEATVLREAIGHDDADVLSNRAQLGGAAALGNATEAEALGLAGEKWHCLGAIPAERGLGLRLWVRIHVMMAGRTLEKALVEDKKTKKTPWWNYEAAILMKANYPLNKSSNGDMRVAELMEALHVPAERWQSSLSDDVFGRVAKVVTLAANERAAAPPRPVDYRPGRDNSSRHKPSNPTRDQPARAAKFG
jgi:hypothetical protein